MAYYKQTYSYAIHNFQHLLDFFNSSSMAVSLFKQVIIALYYKFKSTVLLLH